MNYTVGPMWHFKLIGFERIFTYEEAYAKIPEFWDEICEKHCNHTIYAGKAPSTPQEQAIVDNCIGEYGVCIDDVGNGKFRYLIAGKYTGGIVPDDMTLFEVPGGEWAKFDCVGAVPDALQSLNDYIFKNWLPGNPEYEMAGCYNIEWYSCDGFKSDDGYKSGIWIPVKRYADEVKQKYGNTDEYAQSIANEKGRTGEEKLAVNEGLTDIFREFGKIKNSSPVSAEARFLAAKLQKYITDNFYVCSDDMLKNLGQMYVADDRFKANIDRAGGTGTAEFVNKAIISLKR